MTVIDYPHIQIGEDGVARIGSSRYKVVHLAGEHFYHGWTAEELLRQHTDLKPEEVYSALAYFYDHREELLDQLRTSGEATERLRADHRAISRAEFLARK